MNEIRVKRMLVAGLAMFFMWAAVEFLVELVIAPILIGQTSVELWRGTIDMSHWSTSNIVVNSVIAVLNCTILMWLYASLRPMYGVGTKTALITAAFGVVWALFLFANLINLGLVPARVGLIEAAFEAIEFPIALIVGAGVYEGAVRWNREATG